MVKEKVCPKCGNTLREYAVFCDICGNKVKPEISFNESILQDNHEYGISEGKRQLGGIEALLWISIVGGGILAIYAIISFLLVLSEISTEGQVFGLMIVYGGFFIALLLLLPVMCIRSIKKRYPHGVPLIRAYLVLIMFVVPVGTIIGVILWKRINHPAAKAYFNYSG